MRIATWNIFWLGHRSAEFVIRNEEDERTIGQVIGNFSPDVLAVQEVVDPAAMERVLRWTRAGGRDYAIRSERGAWLTSDATPTDPEDNFPKAFLCLDRSTIEFLRGAAVEGGPTQGRKPYAAALRHRASGHEFVVVVVHLRAGHPDFLGQEDADYRRSEAAALAEWLQGRAAAPNPSFPTPACDDIVVLGDFNAELVDPNRSLDPLFLEGWARPIPAPDGPYWETQQFQGGRWVIDLMFFSPALARRLQSPPRIYAWDYDPALGGPARFHEGVGGAGYLKDYRVSDHRPVLADLRD